MIIDVPEWFDAIGGAQRARQIEISMLHFLLICRVAPDSARTARSFTDDKSPSPV